MEDLNSSHDLDLDVIPDVKIDPEPSPPIEAKPSKSNQNAYYSRCFHARFARVDRTKFKDKIEFLKECRRCGLMRVFVTRRDFNSSNVYINTYWYDVPRNQRAVIDE